MAQEPRALVCSAMAIQPTPKAAMRTLGPKQPGYPPPPHRLNRHAYASPQGKAPCISSLGYVAWLRRRTKSTVKKTSVAPEHAENSGVGVQRLCLLCERAMVALSPGPMNPFLGPKPRPYPPPLHLLNQPSPPPQWQPPSAKHIGVDAWLRLRKEIKAKKTETGAWRGDR